MTLRPSRAQVHYMPKLQSNIEDARESTSFAIALQSQVAWATYANLATPPFTPAPHTAADCKC